MEALGGIATVSTVTTLAFKLSKSLYSICHEIEGATKDIQDTANNVQLLAVVLETLKDVLHRRETFLCRIELVQAAATIAERCQKIFEDIENIAGIKRGKHTPRTLIERLSWVFKKDQVKPMQASLESLKSTLSVLLHVLFLARLTRETVELAIQHGVTEQRKIEVAERNARCLRNQAVSLVVDNLFTIRNLQLLESEAEQIRMNSVEQSAKEQVPPPPGALPMVASKSNSKGQPSFANGLADSAGRSHRSLRARDETKTLEAPRSFPPLNERKGNHNYGDDIPPHELPDCPLYKPRTSELLLHITRHKQGPNDTDDLEGEFNLQSPMEKAESTVDTLLEDYTYVRSSTKRPESSLDTEFPSDGAEVPADEYNMIGDEPYYAFQQPAWNHSDRGSPIRQSATQHKGLFPVPSNRTYDGSEPHPKKKTVENILPPVSRRRSPPPMIIRPRSRGKGILRTSPVKNRRKQSTPRSPSTSSSGSATSSSSSHRLRRKKYREAAEAIGGILEPVIKNMMPYHYLESLEEKRERNLASIIDRIDKAAQGAKEATISAIRLEKERQADTFTATERANPVVLKDCLDRTFILPIESCRSWQAMQLLIASSFLNTSTLSSEVSQGNYDLVGPNGGVILPQVWDKLIQPGWVVQMRLRPRDDVSQSSMLPSLGSVSGSQKLGSGVSATPSPTSPTSSVPHARSLSESNASGRRIPSSRSWLGRRGSSKGSVVNDN